FDDFAVSRNEIPRFDEHDIPRAELRCCHHFELAIGQNLMGHRIRLRFAQVVRLSLAACFGHRLGEIREQHREPEPQRDLNAEQKPTCPGDRILDHEYSRKRCSYFDNEHHGILGYNSWVELDERLLRSTPQDFGIKKRTRSNSFRNELRSLSFDFRFAFLWRSCKG